MTDPKDQRIAALEAQLQAVRAEMQDFTYTVSHDLRAPLRHILSYTHLVQEDASPQLSAEVQGFLDTIANSARHMGVLMDGLLDLSRVGTLVLNPSSVALQPLVQELVDDLRYNYPQRHIEWRVTNVLPAVVSDPALLRQVLLHLLDNAIKFTSPRELAVIEVSAQSNGVANTVTLEVRDNGVGYNPAMQSKLFHPFQRLHSASQFQGIGMGLALTRKIVQRLAGSITAEGAVDAGCVLRLTLPFALD